jgi:tetrapyrrole methylase family protein/MazG family protein
MIIRHPLIFGDVHADTSEKVLKNWENIKKQEKGYQSQTEVLKSVPEVLPALIRAYKVQSKAAQVGFDWSQIGQAMEKVDEEWDEFKEAHEKQQRSEIEEEFGDLLFAVVNIARFLKLNPEFALTKCIEKFINRFEYIENTAVSQGNTLENMTLEEMDSLWDEAKRKLS